MAKARLSYENRLTAASAVITSSSEVADRPDDYLKHEARWKKWRSTTTTGDQSVTWDLGSPQSMQALLLADWKAHSGGGTIRFQAHTANSWASPDVNELLTLPSPNPTKVIGAYLSAAVSKRWVRILFSNVGAVSDYVELAVAFAGPMIEPTFNISDGYSLEPEDQSLIAESDGGHESAYEKGQFLVATARLSRAPDADRVLITTMSSAVRISRPFFFALDAADPNLTIYGRFPRRPKIQHVVRDQFDIDLVVKEVV